MSVPDGSLYPKVPAGSPDPVVLQMPSVGDPMAENADGVDAKGLQYPVGAPDDEEPVAAPGLFTNDRGNLKA